MPSALSRELILENYKNPINIGKPDKYTHSAVQINRSCGDEVEVFLSVKNDQIEAANYEITGCALSIASASIISEALIGMKKLEVSSLDDKFVEKQLGSELTINRKKCATLAFLAFQAALS